MTRAVHAYPAHHEASRFENLDWRRDKTRREQLRWQVGSLRPGQRGAWREWTPVRPQVPPRVVTDGIRVTWINHATVLVQLDGVNVLVDPIYAERASPVAFAGPRRRHAPGVAFDHLPAVDAVLVSHSHYDHMDLPTLRRLVARAGHPPPVVVAGLGNAAYLATRGVPDAVDVDWGDVVTLAPPDRAPAGGAPAVDPVTPASRGRVAITFVPVKHWSARGTSDARHTLWGGYVVAGPSGRVYVGGDTGYGTHFADARARFGAFDVAVLPIGAYRPEWFMGDDHMSPADAVRAARDLGAGVSIPVHHSTFALADDGQDEPVRALHAARAAAGHDAPAFRVLAPGEAWTSARPEPPPDAARRAAPARGQRR